MKLARNKDKAGFATKFQRDTCYGSDSSLRVTQTKRIGISPKDDRAPASPAGV